MFQSCGDSPGLSWSTSSVTLIHLDIIAALRMREKNLLPLIPGCYSANLQLQEDGVVLFHYRHRAHRGAAASAQSRGRKESKQVIHHHVPASPRNLLFVLKDNALVFIYALIHINYFTTWAVSSSRCLKIRFQCQLRGTFQTQIMARSPPGCSASPFSTRWLKVKPSHLNNTKIQAYTSDAFQLHQQMNFFPHNSLAVSNCGVYEEKRRGSETSLCLFVAVEHMEDWIPENSNSKYGVTLALSQKHRVCPGWTSCFNLSQI